MIADPKTKEAAKLLNSCLRCHPLAARHIEIDPSRAFQAITLFSVPQKNNQRASRATNVEDSTNSNQWRKHKSCVRRCGFA
jgi:hypothetical protein